VKDTEVSDVGHYRPRRAVEQGTTAVAEHATTEPVRSEFIAFYVALAKLHGHVRGLRAEERPAGA